MQLLSHAHIRCILNGHLVVGFAEDDPPYEWEFEDSAEYKKGQDGGQYGRSIPTYGGLLRLKIQPNSPTTQWCIEQDQLRKNSMSAATATRTYSGSLSDQSTGNSWRLDGGGILNFPPTLVAGVTYEAALMFEIVTANVSGGRFNAPLVTPA